MLYLHSIRTTDEIALNNIAMLKSNYIPPVWPSLCIWSSKKLPFVVLIHAHIVSKSKQSVDSVGRQVRSAICLK